MSEREIDALHDAYAAFARMTPEGWGRCMMWLTARLTHEEAVGIVAATDIARFARLAMRPPRRRYRRRASAMSPGTAETPQAAQGRSPASATGEAGDAQPQSPSKEPHP